MSDLRPLLAGALAGGLTFLGLELIAGGAPSAADGRGTEGPVAAALRPAGAVGDDDRDDATAVELAMRVASLQAQVEELRSQLGRVDVRSALAAPPSESDLELAASIDDLDTEESRQLVLQVLEDERQREAEEREAAMIERSLDRAASLADRLAEELGLSGADRDTLAEILTDEAQARASVFDDLGDVDWGNGDSRDELRSRLQELRETTYGTVELRLGTDVADAWRESGGRGGRGGFGGFGGGGRRGD